jgi:hypothetical protein
MTILGSRRSGDLVAQTPQPLDQLSFHSGRVPVAKVLHSFLVIRLTCGHHVIIDDQDAVPDCHCGSFGPPPFAQASILLSQIRLRTSRGLRCLNQCRLHIHIGWTRPPALTLACTLLVAWTVG